MESGRSKSRIDPLGETVSEGDSERSPSPRPRPGKVRLDELVQFREESAAAKSEDLQIGRDLLDDTVSELDAVVPGEEDVQLDRILDRPQGVMQDASLHRYDPEAGRTEVSVKIRAVGEAVLNTVSTPFGKLVISAPIFLCGLALAIAAATFQKWSWIIAAGVVFPAGSLLMYWRYQYWLGHKRYMYRLLETLGEDVSDFDFQKRYRKARRK